MTLPPSKSDHPTLPRLLGSIVGAIVGDNTPNTNATGAPTVLIWQILESVPAVPSPSVAGDLARAFLGRRADGREGGDLEAVRNLRTRSDTIVKTSEGH